MNLASQRLHRRVAWQMRKQGTLNISLLDWISMKLIRKVVWFINIKMFWWQRKQILDMVSFKFWSHRVKSGYSIRIVLFFLLLLLQCFLLNNFKMKQTHSVTFLFSEPKDLLMNSGSQSICNWAKCLSLSKMSPF